MRDEEKYKARKQEKAEETNVARMRGYAHTLLQPLRVYSSKCGCLRCCCIEVLRRLAFLNDILFLCIMVSSRFTSYAHVHFSACACVRSKTLEGEEGAANAQFTRLLPRRYYFGRRKKKDCM